jgi:hypothetical protein
MRPNGSLAEPDDRRTNDPPGPGKPEPMPEPRWMSVVIYQRHQAGWTGGEERLPYGDLDAEPLPVEPERDTPGFARRLSARRRSVMRANRGAEGALR